MKTLVIGDVHGDVNEYWKMVSASKYNSIQVGDFGFKKEHEWHLKNVDSSKHKINFGNHDDTSFLSKPHSLGNHSFHNGIFTIRGAESIDKNLRVEGLDWWRDEEMTYKEFQGVIDAYKMSKPNIVVSHDCPQIVRDLVFNIEDSSRTSKVLDLLLEIHKPTKWIFGHHHKSVIEVYNGTEFKCLNELETVLV